MARPEPHHNSSQFALSNMMDQAGTLITSSLAPASQDVYRRGIIKYAKFCTQVYPDNANKFFPASQDRIITFISFLYSQHFSPSTILTYVTAIGFLNKLLNQADYTHTFLVQRCLKGIERSAPPKNLRAPITLSLLHKMLTPLATTNNYENALHAAMFALAFYAFLRVGEFTARNQSESASLTIIQFSDLCITANPNGQQAMQLSLRHYKGNTARTPFIINIPATNTSFCPVNIMLCYLQYRSTMPGPLFCTSKNSPITRSSFTKILNETLDRIGIANSAIKPHSFRIGAATTACASGIPDEQIQRLGRWKSEAYKRYIRIPSHSYKL